MAKLLNFVLIFSINYLICSCHKSANNSITVNNDLKISEACTDQLVHYFTGLVSLEPWAWTMFDASTKFPSGILDGNFYNLGNFDECLSIRTTEEIKAQYCLGTIPSTLLAQLFVDKNHQKFMYNRKIGLSKDGQVQMLGNDPEFSGIHFATCLPAKCSAEDLSILFPLAVFHEKYCYSQETDRTLPASAIATIVVLTFFIFVALLSTLYDIFLYYSEKNSKYSILIAFSYLSNGRKLCSSSARNSDHLTCLNGIKALSMIWIIIAHEYVNGASGAVSNYNEIFNFGRSVGNMFVIGATVAVDTFFVIGGLVTVYAYMQAIDRGMKFNIILYYVHRYVRLTPALGVVVLIHSTLLKYLGEGPLWNSIDDHLIQSCKKHWWAALLYIQNYVHDNQACVPQTWYLSVDMQLFLLSPIILMMLSRKPLCGMLTLGILSVAGIIVPFVIAFCKKLRAFLLADKESTQKYIFSYYEQTYGRFGPYVIGMLLGYFIFKIRKGEIKVQLDSALTVFAFWLLYLGGLLGCVYAGHDIMVSEYNKWAHSFYIAFNRPAWALAISGVIFLCVTGHGGPVNAFLSLSIFQFLSKLSYSTYLIHYAFILARANSMKNEISISHFLMFFNFWGDFMCTLALAVILCLTFESPMIVIEKILFK